MYIVILLQIGQTGTELEMLKHCEASHGLQRLQRMAEEVYGIKPDQVTGVPRTTEIATISGSSEVAEVISLSDSSGKGTPNMVSKLNSL